MNAVHGEYVIAAGREWDVEAAAPAYHDRENAKWSLATRVAFRFCFTYFSLYVLTTLADWPGVKVVPWVGRHLLHLNVALPGEFNGSGDTTFDYVQVLCVLLVAVTATLIWSVLDRKRRNYAKLYQWLKLGVRMALGRFLLLYGAWKVIPSQMPAPSLSRLIESYGDSSPMGLLWTFIGASRGYEMFAGASEMLAGALLLIPGCISLGALLSIAVVGNVFMLNMCYDVPVKLFSFHLLLMAIFLASRDLRNLAGFFLLRRRARLAPDPPLFRRRWLNRAVLAVPLLLGVWVGAGALYSAHQDVKLMGERIGAPLYGIWSVDEYAVDGQAVPPLLSQETRWQRLIFESPEWLMVQSMNGQRRALRLQADTATRTLRLEKFEDQNWKANFTFETPQDGAMVMAGQMDGHQVTARLRRVDAHKMLLTGRGFHWINERPFNR